MNPRWLVILFLLCFGVTSHPSTNLIEVKVGGYPDLRLEVPATWQRFELYWEWSPSANGPWERCQVVWPYEEINLLDSAPVRPTFLRMRARELPALPPTPVSASYSVPYWRMAPMPPPSAWVQPVPEDR